MLSTVGVDSQRRQFTPPGVEGTHVTAAPGLVGLTKVNLREQALASLRTAITSGQLPPESPMIETELSDQLGISRGTLREAMRQLQQEGLLTAKARGRLYVRKLG